MADAAEQKISLEVGLCGFKFHNFTATVGDVTITCQIIKMKDCLYLWIGDFTNDKMEDLSFALTSTHERQPIVTKIMGAVADATSMNIAKRLSMKLGKPVYVSFNLTVDNLLLPGIERRIQNELKTHVDLLSF